MPVNTTKASRGTSTLDRGPGKMGGRIVASGVPDVVAEAEGSLTARYLKAAL